MYDNPLMKALLGPALVTATMNSNDIHKQNSMAKIPHGQWVGLSMETGDGVILTTVDQG